MANEKLIDTVGLKYYHTDIASVTFVGLAGTQNIPGYKTFLVGANIQNNPNSQSPTFSINWNQSSQDGFVNINDDNSQNTLTLDAAALTANRTITFPDASGTVALQGDLNGYLPLSGGDITYSSTPDYGIRIFRAGNVDYSSITKGSFSIIHIGSSSTNTTSYGRTAISYNSYYLNFPAKTGVLAITDDIVQSDWDETTTTSKAYILNKPTLGTAAEKNTGTSAGNIPVLDSNGKLPSSILPSIALTETYVVANQSDMLALDAQVGDVCVVTSENKTYILATAGASTLSHWQEIVTPSSSGFVTSVNNKTGTVTLTASDVGAVATTASQGLSTTQKSNARANIGAAIDNGWTIASTTDIDTIFA